MSTFKQAVTALDDYLEAGSMPLPVYHGGSEGAPDPAVDVDGWIELSHEFGEQGPTGGRFGPASTYYNSRGVLTATVMVPIDRGDGPAWDAADAIANRMREKTVGDCTVRSVRVSPAPLDGDDTHHQIDVLVAFELEAFV